MEFRTLSLPAARTTLRKAGWGLVSGEPRFNCEFIDPERDAATSAHMERYLQALGEHRKWREEHEEFMQIVTSYYPHLGIFGLVWAPYKAGLTIPHIRQHDLGSLAHSGDRKCVEGEPSNMSAALAVANMSPQWIGTMHGVILAGMRKLPAKAHPTHIWRWALSDGACDYEGARRGRQFSADGSASSVKTYSACVHGLGHGMMLKALDDSRRAQEGAARTVPAGEAHKVSAQPSAQPLLLAREAKDSLWACAQGPRPAEACQCASGVYMQWQMSVHVISKGEMSILPLCMAENRYAAPCWLRYWSMLADASPAMSVSRDTCVDETYRGRLGVEDPCAKPGLRSGSREHGACVFGWAKACFLLWAGSNIDTPGPAQRRAGALHRSAGEGAPGLPPPMSLQLPPGVHSRNASHPAILHYCSALAPEQKRTLAWRACIFGAVSDVARNKAYGVALMTRQQHESARQEEGGSWSVLCQMCSTFFPGADSELSQLCLEALLSHADVKHYSPCAHSLLDV